MEKMELLIAGAALGALFMTFVLASYLWEIKRELEEIKRRGCELDDLLDASDVDFTPMNGRTGYGK